ncbi:hypothetical protein MTO96_037233, partial [Rhipicephalus appendiculatus]
GQSSRRPTRSRLTSTKKSQVLSSQKKSYDPFEEQSQLAIDLFSSPGNRPVAIAASIESEEPYPNRRNHW